MSFQKLKSELFIQFWKPTSTVLLAGVLSSFYFGITGTFWAVTGELTRWGGHLLQLFGLQPESWGYFKIIHLEGNVFTRIDGLMILGMLTGCFSAALWANNFKIRFPKSKVRVFQAITGGIIAGYGARLAMGCNLAAFFTGIPQFSLHAWLFALATALGSYFGAKVSMLAFFRIPVILKKTNGLTEIPSHPKSTQNKFKLGLLIFISFLIFALFKAIKEPKLGLAGVFGLVFGLLIERGQICFTSAFRDLWLTGRTQMAKAIIAGMAISTIGVFSYSQLGVPLKILWAGPNSIIGGILFGFGIVIAGGCETGWMYRAVEGQVHYWWVGLGNIIGATLLAAQWDDLAPALATNFDKINLLQVFGPIGGLAFTYLAFFVSFLLILFWENKFFAKHKSKINSVSTESPS